jgi:CRP/FNR family transcriptional regulator
VASVAACSAAERALRRCGVFAGLDDRTIRTLAAGAQRRLCKRGALLWRGDEAGGSIFVVESGCLRHYHAADDGRESTLAVLFGGDVLGLRSDGRSADPEEQARALIVDAVVYRLPPSRVLEVMAASLPFAIGAVALLSGQLAEAYDAIKHPGRHGVRGRLARMLVRIERHLGSSDGAPRLAAATHEELAALVGTSRETVTRELKKLRACGLIAYESHQRDLRLLDVEQLAAL